MPVRRGGHVVAALAFEIGVIEHERQKRKSPVFRRAIDAVRRGALTGELVGGRDLARFGEHDGALVIDAAGRITYISSIAEQLYRKRGYSENLLGSDVASLRTDESIYFEALESGACLEKTGQEGAFVWRRWALPIPQHPPSPWLPRMPPRTGRIDAVLVNIRDVTEELRQEQELKIKQAMIQEIHHRVKNNLQTIAALLRLQSRRSGSPEVSEMLGETINRILSIAVVHEFLSHDQSSIVDVRDVCHRLMQEVHQSIHDPEKRITFTVDGPMLPLPAQQATACALVVNELLQNAVRHAFDGRTEGHVSVQLADDEAHLTIEVVDDGIGVGPAFDARRQGNLGLQIVRTLVGEDLRGQFRISQNGNVGSRATIRFPKTLEIAHPLDPDRT
jgi:two-component sensor histidine kinase